MPTYEYRCRSCGHEFERFQKMTDDPLRDCPNCGRPDARRRISAGGGVLFRGPGFYATDYRKPSPGEKGEKKEAKSEAKPGSGGGSGAKKSSGSDE